MSKLDFSQGKQFRARGGRSSVRGWGKACDPERVDCLRVGQDATATHTFNGLATGNYWIVVQSFTGTEGSTTHHPVDQRDHHSRDLQQRDRR